MQVLWIDDDSPEEAITLEGVTVYSVQDLAAAESVLSEQSLAPCGYVVDLLVPQGGWGEGELLADPGIAYIKHMREKWKISSPVVAYGIVVSDRDRERIAGAGGDEAFQKDEISLAEVIGRVKDLCGEKGGADA